MIDIPPQERQLQSLNNKVVSLEDKLDRVIELLTAMNSNLTTIKGNTRKAGGPLGG